MKKATCSVLALLLALAFMLTACNTAAPASTPDPTTATATEAPTASPEPTPESPYKDPVTLTYYVSGTEYPDAPTVYEAVNKLLQQNMNTTVNFKYVSYDNYKVMVSSGEAFDIIGIVDWMGFWDFAAKGAFAELTDELIQKNCPNISTRSPEELNLDKLDGKRYAIPNFGTNVYNDVIIARGDLMDKYSIKSVSGLDEMEAYLDAIAKNEKDILPYAQNSPWEMPAFFYSSMGWQSPGAPNCTSPGLIDVFAGDYKVFDPISRPETRDFAKRMKNWVDRGFWSKSALSSKFSPVEVFMTGKSGMCVVNLDGANSMYKAFEADERKAWDIRMFSAYPKFTSAISNNGTGTAISCNSKYVDRSLAVIDALKSDTALNRLMMHGIEDTHYKLLPDNQRLPLNDKGYNWTLCGLDDADTFLFVGGGFPDAASMLSSLKANVKPNKTLGFNFDSKPVEQQATALNDAYNQYAAPLFLGIVDDVDKAYDEYVQKRADAGIDAYNAELQRQVDAYVANK